MSKRWRGLAAALGLAIFAAGCAQEGKLIDAPLAVRSVAYDEVIDSTDLVVPHPRYRERRFVLEPLAEVAADWRDPRTGRTVSEMLAALSL